MPKTFLFRQIAALGEFLCYYVP